MPIRYRVVNGCVLTTFSGPISYEEILAHAGRLETDPLIESGLAGIVDMREVEGGSLTFNGLLALVDQLDEQARRHAGSKLAIVAPRDFAFGMGRTYSMLGAHQWKGIHVFRTLEEAEGWIGVRAAEVA